MPKGEKYKYPMKGGSTKVHGQKQASKVGKKKVVTQYKSGMQKRKIHTNYDYK